MPPKKDQKQGSSSKVKDDKTFGLKNKNKSSKVQKQIAIIKGQEERTGKSRAEVEKEREKELRAKAKAEEEKRKLEDAALLKPVLPPQKVALGVDPKSVVCQYFKLGACDKGKKCRFSHDLNVERKVEKKNLYEDDRDPKLDDTMDKWDETKLREVVTSKHGNPRTTTDIVCKFFIQAIEDQRFGWFWECPNGPTCMYRHALPPGFVLKSQKKAMADAEKANVISLEEFLEVERHKLGSNLTPVTPESFATWKRTRLDKKEAEAEALKNAKKSQQAAGKLNGMSGRDLFTYNPEWLEEEEGSDDEDWDISAYRKEKEEEDAREEERLIEQFNAGFAAVGSGGGQVEQNGSAGSSSGDGDGDGDGDGTQNGGDDGGGDEGTAGPSGSAT
ncbi:hypothetical protein FRB95_009837 [Tulasnella sp. JGI-2019a]|nr:hypothetical protein FRB93_009223 [Tulasnella sp. JGI-2019a]KAG9025722.1 hypothetical protein FRB95_009837 [Tulasnella sp. JGI-2019a]